MRRLNRYLIFIAHSRRNELLKAIHLYYLLFFTYLLVNYIPLQYYYKKYLFSDKDVQFDMQPFQRDFSLLKKLQRYFPARITCLIDSMVKQSYLKKHGIIAPIKLGLSSSKGLSAHAWIGKSNLKNEFRTIAQ